MYKGRTPKYNNIEQLLVNFIDFNRKALNPITTWCIDIEMFRLITYLKEIRYKTILQWIYRFLIRHNYTYRKHTHLGQSLPQESLDLIDKFVSNCYKSRLSMKYEDNVIVNMDETPLTLNLPPNYVIEKKDKKSVIIRHRIKKNVSLLGHRIKKNAE